MAGKGDKYRPVNSEKFRSNYDKIFKAKKSSRDWCQEIFGVDIDRKVLDPDGWRYNDGVDYDTPITRLDFNTRLSVSTAYWDQESIKAFDNENNGGNRK